MPPLMNSISTPSYRDETVGYNSHLQLTNFAGKETHFVLGYKSTAPSRVETLFLPVGENDALVDLYAISYDPPIAGQKAGKTMASRKDGVRVEYLINSDLRLSGILFFAPEGKLKKEKTLEWDPQGRLKSVSWKDGDGELYWSRSYEEYDCFGNPEKECFLGDKEESVIWRKYSQDNRNLVLREENEDGKIVLYEYVPNTNLKSAKFVLDGDKILLREFWKYDDCLNLLEHAIDDGSSKEREVLEGVKERIIVRYELRQEVPFLHMPEWIEEFFWDGEKESLLRKKQLKYDKWGNISEEEIYGSDGEFAYKISREYDEQGNVLAETNPLGYRRVLTHTAKGQLSTEKNFSSTLQKRYRYDLRGRLKTLAEVDLKNETEHEITYEYNWLDRCIEKTDYFGQTTIYGHDPISGEINFIQGPSIDGIEVMITRTFDGLGRMLTEKDPNGHTIRHRYNGYGSIIETIYPDESKETSTQYKNGNLKSHTDRNGLEIHYEYDLFNRVKEKKFVFEEKKVADECFLYNAFHLIEHKDKTGRITNWEYDRSGRKKIETFCGRPTIYSYNQLGQIQSVEENNTVTTEYDRDYLDQILELRKIDHHGQVRYRIGYSWDPEGRQTSITRYPHNHAAQETFAYDPFGRLIEYKDPLGFATTTDYQESSFLKSISMDPNGIATIKTYDIYGRLALLEIGCSYSQKNHYDRAGNLILIEEDAVKTGYTYDSLNRVKTLTRAMGSPEARGTSYTYKPGGELLTKTLPNGTVLSHTYTPLGYLSTLDASDDSVHQTYQTDLNGKLLSGTDNGHLLTRTLDDFGNVLIETIDGITYNRTYDPLNRLKSITFPDQSSVEYTYASYHLSRVRKLSPLGKESYFHTYLSYDQSGNLLFEHPIHSLGTQSHTWNANGTQASLSGPHFSQTITYDPSCRVKEISSDGRYDYNDQSELILEDFGTNRCTYGYDTHSNRKQKNGVAAAYNCLDEHTDLKYDLNGNIRQNGSFEYSYDALNRLVSTSSPDTQITFAYDVFDRCISKTVNGKQECYLYHGTEELGSFFPNGRTKELKVPGLGLKPIAIELDGKVFAPICDYRGNIRRLVDVFAQVAESYDYTAFGEELKQPKSLSNPWRYSAKRIDPLLGLYSFGKRFYNPRLGRWITTDPAGLIDGTNLYTFLHNDPLRNFDPTGEIAIPLFSIAFGGAAFCPLTWGVIAAVGVGYAACWSVQHMLDNGSVQPGTPGFTIASGMAGALTTSLMNHSIDSQARPFGRGNYLVESLPGDAMEFMYLSRKKEGSVDPSLPANPDELLKRPGWKETSHPEAKAKGHRTFENKKTGEKLRHDEGKVTEQGHEAHDHYHRPNPHKTGKRDEYLDHSGNPVPRNSDESHLYSPENVWWKK